MSDSSVCSKSSPANEVPECDWFYSGCCVSEREAGKDEAEAPEAEATVFAVAVFAFEKAEIVNSHKQYCKIHV